MGSISMYEYNTVIDNIYYNASGDKLHIGDTVDLSFMCHPIHHKLPYRLVDVGQYFSTVSYLYETMILVQTGNNIIRRFFDAKVYSPQLFYSVLPKDYPEAPSEFNSLELLPDNFIEVDLNKRMMVLRHPNYSYEYIEVPL